MKRILIGIIVFLAYLGLVIAGGFALHFEGGKLVLFCIILGLLGALATIFVLWYLDKLARAAEPDAGADSADAVNLQALLRDGNARIRQAGRAGIKSIASMPIIYVIGDENSAKTQTVLQSGIDPELISGAVYRDGTVVPTQLVNIWLAGNNIVAEAGGALLRQPALWSRFIKATLPARLGSVFSKKNRLPARAVLVCVSIERIMAPNTAENIRSLAQTINERLRQLSGALGASMAVYVLFTKLDTIGPFADYVAQLSQEEVRMPIGAVIAPLDTGSGLYTERAMALVGEHIDRLLFALSEFRLEVLSRGGELPNLAHAYEFPRDLGKLRAGMISFLTEVARPSQVGVNPFLRGFFFSGMRAQLVEDVVDLGPSQARMPSAIPIEAGATRIFSLAGAPATPQAPQPVRRGTRKMPQWVFLPHLFSTILLADRSALEASRASTRTSFLRSALLASTSAVLLLLLALFTTSFFRNRSIEQRLASSVGATVSPVSSDSFASQADLTTLDQLRALLDQLNRYRTGGAPFLDRMGLYQGDNLFPLACQAYTSKFRSLLLAPTQENILATLRALPASPSPDSDYGSAYRPLKAYIMTTSSSNPDSPEDTLDFLPQALLAAWAGAGTPDPAVTALAKAQFELYSSLLASTPGCVNSAGGSPNAPAVASARAYLNGFQGFQHVYQSMLAAANRRFPSFDFNSKCPGSSQYIVDQYTIQGAFTKDGFGFMQDAILHPDPYFRGEEWVLGPSNAAPVDRAALSAQLHSSYYADYLQTWRTYLNRAQFVPFKSFPDAANKLSALDSNTSAILELFSLISTHTGVAAPEISTAFQAPQTVVPASSPDNRLIGSSNQAYIQALQGIEGAVKNLILNPTALNDPAAVQPIIQASTTADQAAGNLRNSFVPDPSGHLDKTSFDILEAPIRAIQSLAAQAPAAAAGGAAKSFCSQTEPLLAKFPFNPQAAVEATPDEVAQVFAPDQGSFAQFYDASLKALIVQQGSQFISAPGSAVKINPAFLNFLDNAQRLSSGLFPNGGKLPGLNFSLTEVRSPGVSEAKLSIDGTEIHSLGQSATFHWVSQAGSRITLATQKNTAPVFSGPWAVFHFSFSAPEVAPNRLKFSFSFNNQTPEIVLFDASGPGAPLLNPEFMKAFHCVSIVAK
jgi:type VI secretion system protein ImpL